CSTKLSYTPLKTKKHHNIIDREKMRPLNRGYSLLMSTPFLPFFTCGNMKIHVLSFSFLRENTKWQNH
ncbi:hypothetical protein JW926_18915, partial [Candidatus Sumerlaeota bacterium]|nr:hypothetical protein [Candidatus Sumerlaeota bacterium]